MDRPTKEELLAQFYRKDSRSESVKRRLSGIGERIPIVPVLVVFMLILVVIFSGVIVSRVDMNVDFSSYSEKTRAPVGWSDEVRVTNEVNDSTYQKLAFGNSKLHLTWMDMRVDNIREIYYKNSTDDGLSWSSAQRLSHSLGTQAMFPSIAINGSETFVVWEDYRDVPGADLFINRSLDGGQTWEGEYNITPLDNDNTRHPDLVHNGSTLHLVYEDDGHILDDGFIGEQIHYMQSKDGVTWTDGLGGNGERWLFQNTSSQDLEPKIALNGSTIHMVWTRANLTYGWVEIFYSRSEDGGTTWMEPTNLSVVDSYFDIAPRITVSDAFVHVVWEADKSTGTADVVTYRRSTDGGQTWEPQQIWVQDGNVSEGASISVEGSYVNVAWGDERDGDYDIFYRNSTDNGVSWTGDIKITDYGWDCHNPDILTKNGNVYLTWRDERTGSIEKEIYFKRNPDFPSIPEFPNMFLPIMVTISIIVMFSRYKKGRCNNEKRKHM